MERYDREEIYCRKLGHNLNFKYCRSVSEGIPCFKIRDCWFQKISIDEYLNEVYSDEEIAKILTPPKEKVLSILELIEKAKGNV
ncbi:hypothetical protein ACFL20_11085 [Spirochaetota bacterium]